MDQREVLFPGYRQLPTGATPLKTEGHQEVPKVNGHIHTPYSFSAFHSMEQPFVMAREEGIAVLGINDFYTMDGYGRICPRGGETPDFPLIQHRIHGPSKGRAGERHQGE